MQSWQIQGPLRSERIDLRLQLTDAALADFTWTHWQMIKKTHDMEPCRPVGVLTPCLPYLKKSETLAKIRIKQRELSPTCPCSGHS
jgi:hypothetical protein